MTDRVNALTVVLDVDTRVDDVEALMSAIRMMKGVRGVSGNVVELQDHIAYVRARTDVEQLLWDALQADREKPRGA